ncbi:hypothetical protein TIFTF001_015354 [Ficus carica]|uniref:Uncharacterized protein n=1 Tax=Ficus carica TaxID=3494 RepID=A0AA88ALF2_FICCA|nr:hypothetical protein TIFTF001_015354 [Ficus carica]
MITLTWEARHDVSPLTCRLLECWFCYLFVAVRLADKAGGGSRRKAAFEGIQSSEIEALLFHLADALEGPASSYPFSGWLFQMGTMPLGSRARMGLQTKLSVVLISAFLNNVVSNDGNDNGSMENSGIDNCLDIHSHSLSNGKMS